MKTREFGELEAAIMDALWTADRALAVREIRETMTYRRDVAYTTVMTVANILFNKGVLHREKVGRAWRYQPRESREEHTARVMSEVLREGGDREATMIRLIEGFSDEEMARLHEALAEVRLRRGIAS
ncbi:BlaI/MecI/CopY family transcriptional regulator [Thermobifida alba]|jgi:predicted transcriptional regulator|uniref:BlaI/MecI/CopY family transcriptional regulator n=1 Tax=Thermobifida alba TaxID=53522 RepID=A0ABY4L5U6_THEAE|nr:BlaI/MecI/CopY family transcriptional regulator [Thermobifida alba]UPT23068.1 BlaI/MecI/CopY family transcriptional regulator [Thermobifida alba]HLU99566.1 BlaI/MecI/CopY family transcriptional regulator [Thermobifida alba]